MLRTLTHPLVWRGLREHILDDGQIDLFAVLGMAADAKQSNRQGREGPREVERMLAGLRPRRTRFVNWEVAPPPCDVGGLGKHRQFAKWSTCVDLIPLDGGYDFLLRTRPDVVWRAPLHLERLAAQMPADDVVLTKYDWHMLWPRAQWPALSAMRSVGCDRRCANGFLFDDYNEYCIMKAHLAKHGIRQLSSLEATPEDREVLLHYVSELPWTQILRNDSDRLARWKVSPRPRLHRAKLGMVCRWEPKRGGVACHECCAHTAAHRRICEEGGAETTPPVMCPSSMEESDLVWPSDESPSGGLPLLHTARHELREELSRQWRQWPPGQVGYVG